MFRYSLTGARVRYRKVLELAFADGRQGNADLGPLMGQGGIFAPLASDQTFRIFTVKNGIVWNEAIDIAGEYLYFLVMLTSAGRSQWPHDLLLEDWARAGLKKPTILERIAVSMTFQWSEDLQTVSISTSTALSLSARRVRRRGVIRRSARSSSMVSKSPGSIR